MSDMRYPKKGTYYYEFQKVPGGYMWFWFEKNLDPELGCDGDKSRVFPTRAEALRDAADDWESNGGEVTPLARTLRAAATREERLAE
ncbi:hypothetical protein M2390_003235 [Mycetocola sp. BIGb0189]|uniref:hypothetical protein n=1 Tax=Mycetocola sp. BIGb0189 TaxID=2940604 RepID=UPI0021680046|nr:hypothetical protein [Mycetocola sp. BIGb0189]MCS4278015.1 hypothetical protein [Mycetocola sp. BIGb0189]